MINCSNSFEFSFKAKNNSELSRPKTHRPHTRSRQIFYVSQTPTKQHQSKVSHQRSLVKYAFNRSVDCEIQQPATKIKCTTEQNIDEDIAPEQRRKIFKNINKSNRAIRPSIPKKIEPSSLSSIALNKIRLVPQLKINLIKPLQLDIAPDPSTQRKRPHDFNFLSVPPSQGLSMIKTKQMKNLKYPFNNSLHETVKHFVDYKITQSKVLFASGIQEFKIEESMVDERDPLVNFKILKDLEINADFSEQIGIQRHIGICVSLKKMPIKKMELIYTEKRAYQVLSKQHPNILCNYQQLLNGLNHEYIFVREFYDSYLKYQLLTKQEFKKYFKNILMIFHQLSRKNISYASNVYENIVISRNVCKLTNFQNCKLQQPEIELRKNYKRVVRNILDIMINQVVEVDLTRDREFIQFLKFFEKCHDFMQTLTHKYLIPASTSYII